MCVWGGGGGTPGIQSRALITVPSTKKKDKYKFKIYNDSAGYYLTLT